MAGSETGDLLGKTEFALRDAVLKLGAQTLEGAVNEQAEQQIALSDGAVCLEKFLKTHFPQAVLILDFFHAAEHLAELARAIYPPTSANQNAGTSSGMQATCKNDAYAPASSSRRRPAVEGRVNDSWLAVKLSRLVALLA